MKDYTAPILSEKHYEARSVFTPENILREARRQKGLATAAVPAVCVLDPDGDIVRHLTGTAMTRGRAITLSCTSRPSKASTLALSLVRLARHTPFWSPNSYLQADAVF